MKILEELWYGNIEPTEYDANASKAWRNAAGNQYRYYMVFRDGENLPNGAVSISEFVEIIKKL